MSSIEIKLTELLRGLLAGLVFLLCVRVLIALNLLHEFPFRCGTGFHRLELIASDLLWALRSAATSMARRRATANDSVPNRFVSTYQKLNRSIRRGAEPMTSAIISLFSVCFFLGFFCR